MAAPHLGAGKPMEARLEHLGTDLGDFAELMAGRFWVLALEGAASPSAGVGLDPEGGGQ